MGTEGASGGREESAIEAGGPPGGRTGEDGRAGRSKSPEAKESAGREGSEASGGAGQLRLPWVRVQDQAVVAVLVGVVLVSLGVYYGSASGWGRREIEVERLPEHELDYRIDPNRANWVELMQLPRIGKTLAERIVKDREERGPYQSVDDLVRVRGIGKVNLETIRPYLRVEEKTEDRSQEPEVGREESEAEKQK